MDFKNIETKYRPVPFWSWNEKLDTAETARQAELMADAGMGGYFMHARGGLQTEYMGQEWFDNVAVGIAEAKKHGMYAWAYDENGWPSGFGNGKVNGLGIEYQQKYLRMEEGEKQTDTTVCNFGGKHFYYDVNPFYVDTLDAKVIQKFLDEVYQPYYERYGTEFEGFFTDEPQISRNGIPWSFILPDEYRKAYGEELLPRLNELFEASGSYKDTRFKFWKLVTELFSKNFFKQIYDWCREHGLRLTGHCVLEEGLGGQITSNGAVMPHYEYFDIPGMDWLGRPIRDVITPLQVSSVAAQLGKKQVLSETFALCGHNVGFHELKGIFEWQMVHGVTLLCQHLEGYSLRGIRKRDYPPAMYYQQPWWEEYHRFNESMSRIGKILTEGKVEYDTLMIHPISTAWLYFDNKDYTVIDKYRDKMMDTVHILERKHILFHMGDETIMERHARVEGDTLVIGEQRYHTVVLPPHEVLFDSTKRLLEEFEKNGGVIAAAEDLPENPVVDNPNITYTKRAFDGYDIYYFVNSTHETHQAKIAPGSKRIDISTGEILPFDGNYTFAEFDSLLVLDDHTPRMDLPEEKEKALDLSGEWKITSMSDNVLTLDFCDYWFDSVLQEKQGYVLNIQNRACALERPLYIKCEYTVQAEFLPDELYLVCETPENFEISVNGKPLVQKDCGYFADRAFRKLDISGMLRIGKNKISLAGEFRQSAEVYENLKKSKIFESEKNKLTYDMEIEPIYLVGKFGVKNVGAYQELERRAERFSGEFILTAPPRTVALQHMEQQGLTFFAGALTLEKEFDLDAEHYCVSFQKTGVNSIKVAANGQEAATLLWEPFRADLSGLLRKGKNTVTLTLRNNLRNMLGPHHLKEGESYSVGPHSFFKEPCVWNPDADKTWKEDYCFVEMSVENKR